MGLSISVVDERGRQLEVAHDTKNRLHRLLTASADTSGYLKYIDWYGATVFNRPQMEVFVPEWKRLMKLVESPEDRRISEVVLKMAHQVRDDVHLYLRFEGD
jgi:hypothetical protein